MYMTTQAPHAIRTVIALVAGHVGLTEERSVLYHLISGVALVERFLYIPVMLLPIAVSFLNRCAC